MATWLAPKFLSIQVLPVLELVTSTTVADPDAQKTEPAGYVGTIGEFPQPSSTQSAPFHDCKQFTVVLYIVKPAAGEAMASRCAVVICGGKKPWVVLAISTSAPLFCMLLLFITQLVPFQYGVFSDAAPLDNNPVAPVASVGLTGIDTSGALLLLLITAR